jgi:hypothetical protein
MARWLFLSFLTLSLTPVLFLVVHWFCARYLTYSGELDAMSFQNSLVQKERQKNFWHRELFEQRNLTEENVEYAYNQDGSFDIKSPANLLNNALKGFGFSIMIVGALWYSGQV